MVPPVSLRLGEETRRQVARIARRKKVPAGTLMRQVIEQWAEREEKEVSPYDALARFIGVVQGRDPARSTWSSRKIAKLLKDRRRRSWSS